MVKDRKTPEDDIERLAERVWDRGREKIQDRSDFEAVFLGYMVNEGRASKSKKLRDAVFNKIVELHPGKVFKGRLHANGEREKVFSKLAVKPTQQEFDTFGFVKGRVVKVRQTHYYAQGRRRVVFRDIRGRFARIKPPPPTQAVPVSVVRADEQ